MSDVKRVEFTSMPPSENGVFNKLNKTNKEKRPTVRISLALIEPTENGCCEYNYKNELRSKLKELDVNKESKYSSHTLPDENDDEDNDDDVRRIAEQMEKKYGSSYTGVKKKKSKKDDYADIGMGYDESDSFIDNTDGYDEMVPQHITTLHGGFYINSGALEFKQDEEALDETSSSSDESTAPVKTQKRKILDSDSDEEKPSSVGIAPKKAKLRSPIHVSSAKKKLLNVKIKKKINLPKKTVKEILKEKRKDLNMSDIPATPLVKEENLIHNNKESSSIAETIESVIKAVSTTESPKQENANRLSISNDNLSIKLSDDQISVEISPSILPQNLPADLLEDINKIKNAAENSNDRQTTFNEAIDQLLLSLERKSRCVGKPSKLKIYEYLSNLLNCKKQTVISHCRSILLKSEEQKLKQLIIRLKTEIDRIMPRLLSSYEEESRQFAVQKKFSGDENRMRGPKRRFQWSEMSRKTLQEILKTRKKCFILEDKPREVLDALMTSYLKSHIQILWPEGWMSISHLLKVYTGNLGDPERKAQLTKNTKSIEHPKDYVKISCPIKDAAKSNTNTQPIIKPSNVESGSVQENSHHTDDDNTLPVIENNQFSKEKDNHIQSVKAHHKEQCLSVVEDMDVTLTPDENEFVNFLSVDKVDHISNSSSPGLVEISKEDKCVRPEHKKHEDTNGIEEVSSASSKADSLVENAITHNFIKENSSNSLKQVPSTSDRLHDHKEVLKNNQMDGNINNLKKNYCESQDTRIQKLMEELKVLQKMTAPVKTSGCSQGSQVSVITSNRTSSPKQSTDNIPQHTIADFQEEFQMQFLESLGQDSLSSKSLHNNCN